MRRAIAILHALEPELASAPRVRRAATAIVADLDGVRDARPDLGAAAGARRHARDGLRRLAGDVRGALEPAIADLAASAPAFSRAAC